LFEQGLQLIKRRRTNMKNHLMPFSYQLVLRKRANIDYLKNISQNEHSRYSTSVNFVAHPIAGLFAYRHQDKKPGLHLDVRPLLAA